MTTLWESHRSSRVTPLRAAELLKRQQFPRIAIDVTREVLGGMRTGVLHTITAVNSYQPGSEPVSLFMPSRVPEFVTTDADFHDWCLANLLWFAEHEVREWFRVDGQLWRDPHHPVKPQRLDTFAEFERVRAMRAE